MKSAVRSSLLLVVAVAAGCSEKLPARFAAIPADADVVVSLEIPPLLAFSKEVLAQAVPAEMRDKIPSLELLAKQAMQLAGVNLDSISRVTVIGYLHSQERMAIIAEGLNSAGLKGEKKSERAGIAIHAIGERIFYAGLSGLGVAFAPDPEVLGQVIDAFAGKQKNLTDGDTGKILRSLSKQESDKDQIRAYFANGKLAAGNPQFSIQGAGVFFHLERGVSAVILSDSASVTRMKQGLDLAMMAFQTSLAFGGAKDNPLGLDAKATQRLGELLRKVSSRQDGDRLVISFGGDLRPIAKEAVGLLLEAFKPAEEEAAPRPAPEAPAPPAPPAPAP